MQVVQTDRKPKGMQRLDAVLNTSKCFYTVLDFLVNNQPTGGSGTRVPTMAFSEKGYFYGVTWTQRNLPVFHLHFSMNGAH